ncbi:type II secretion system protein [Enterobacter hormaechei]
MFYLNSKSKFKGFSLLELLLVMGSFAAIVAIGFWIYSLALERQRINTAQKQLASIQKGMNDVAP